MTPLDVWLAIFTVFLISLIGRSAYLFAPSRWYPRGALAQALSFAPLAAMVAICVPEVFSALRPVIDGNESFRPALLLDKRLVTALVLFALLKTVRKEFLCLAAAGALFWWLAR